MVLITGDAVKRSDRHGRDGRHDTDGLLLCEIHPMTKTSADKAIRDKQSRDELLKAIAAKWDTWQKRANKESKPEESKPVDNIGCREVDISSPPWNPLFLDWGIDLYPAAVPISKTRGATGTSPTPGYHPKVITTNYQLGSQYPDLQTQDLQVQDNPDRLSGRCILGDTADLILRDRIEDFLNRQLQSRLYGLGEALKDNSQNRSEHLASFIDRLIDQGLTTSPTNADARSHLRRLIEPWANLDSGDPSAQNDIQALATWYKTLADTHAQVSLKALPKTPAQLNALVDWYRQRPRANSQNANGQHEAADPIFDPIFCTLLAYRWLFDNAKAAGDDANVALQPRAFLSQSLSGFNGELMQWKLGLRLPIDEPIGLTDYREFTQQIANHMGNEAPWTTEPTNQFSPLRTGALVLNQLRLVDNFGQVAEVPCRERVIVPSPYRVQNRPGVAFLPPRLVQPARVKFRWLEADPTHPKEMAEAEAKSPICGWLLRDRINNSLLVFDGQGSPLGSLVADRSSTANPNVLNPLKWVQAPGRSPLTDADCEAGRQHLRRVSPTYFDTVNDSNNPANQRDLGELGASIANGRLARVLLYLWATKSPRFLDAFLNTLDDAMANIDPEGVTSMGSLALLMGRPIAVVGAELDLALQQAPAVRQDWEAFRLDLFRHQRDSYQFDQVQFQLRLGQYQSRNDGVLGYWREKQGSRWETDTFTDNTFVAQAASDDDPSLRLELNETVPGLNARINAHDAHDAVDGLNFIQSVADPPLRTTILFDPRGKAHLTSGILPVKAIDIPRSLWEPALEALQLWLPIAPMVTHPNRRQVPIPTLVDHHWRWQERIRTGGTPEWQTLDPVASLTMAELQVALDNLKTTYPQRSIPTIDRLVTLGWLTKLPLLGDRLYLGRREDRKPLDDPALEPPLDRDLAKLSLALVSPGEEPNFDPGTEVREGWLLLKPGSNPP